MCCERNLLFRLQSHLTNMITARIAAFICGTTAAKQKENSDGRQMSESAKQGSRRALLTDDYLCAFTGLVPWLVKLSWNNWGSGQWVA
jgi:hypothetical protein